jgi:uncharacterized protein YndB with AHSA1/START domain
MSDPSQPIVVEQAFGVSTETLWQAITNRQHMVQWFFEEIPEFQAEVGFQTQFNVSAGERDFLHLWKITEVNPGQKIVYDWRYEGYAGVGKVTFEVLQDGTGSKLRVTTEGVETFPQEVPEFSPESCQGGWEYFVQECLKGYLEG